MIFMRIIGQGRISELLESSEESLEADIFLRQMNWRTVGEDEINKLTAETRELCQAYCDGVTEYGLIVPQPLRMVTRRVKLEPWTIEDIILLIRMTAYLSLAQSQGEMELLILQMVQNGVSGERLRELFPQIGDDLDEELIRKVKLRRKLVPDGVKWTYTSGRLMASNNWVVAGRRTASGKPILAGDIHLEVNRLPNVWYQQVLQIGPRYFAGATLPGVPSLIVGRTPDLSWTPTYAFMDSEDSWIERCRDGKYLVEDSGEKWHPIESRQEIILRRAKPAHKHTYWSTHHGVLDSDPPSDGYSLATNWTGSRSGARTLNCATRLWSASNVEDGMALLSQVESAWNWVLADRHGSIAYQMSGLMPKRRAGASGLVPLAGWDKANDWQGYVAASELPRLVNPEQGYFATANNDLNRFGKVSPINLPMGTYRADRIAELLGLNDKVTVADVQRMHYDVYSRQGAAFMAILRPLLPDTAQGHILRDWDCRYDLESKGAFLFEAVYEKLLISVFGNGGTGEVPGYLYAESGIFVDFYANFDRILLAEDSLWFGDQPRDELYRRVVVEALKIRPKPWSVHQRVVVSYLPFQGKAPQLLRLIGLNRQIHLPGGRATVQQGQIYRSANRETTFAPGYRFITDMSNDEAYSNMPGGPCECPYSKWYASDLRNWRDGRYKTLSAPE